MFSQKRTCINVPVINVVYNSNPVSPDSSIIIDETDTTLGRDDFIDEVLSENPLSTVIDLLSKQRRETVVESNVEEVLDVDLQVKRNC